MDNPYAFPEKEPFQALPATTRGEIVLLLRGSQRDLWTHGPGTKKVPAEALARILPALSSQGLDHWADLFWKDAERLMEIAETPHARSQTDRQRSAASRVDGAFTQYAKWHMDQSQREELALDNADRAEQRPTFSHRGAAGELRLAFRDGKTPASIINFKNLSPARLTELVRLTVRYLEHTQRDRPEQLADIYLGLHYDRKHLPSAYQVVFSGLNGPLSGQNFASELVGRILTYAPDTGLTLNTDIRALKASMAEYSANYDPRRDRDR